MIKQIKPALLLLAVFTILTGIIYPLLISGLAQIIFPSQANGSLLVQNGKIVGSGLIGQSFDQPGYFWGRLSATGDHPYNASSSGGSNLSVLNQSLSDAVSQRIKDLKSADPDNTLPIPVDLVTASASGLDPDISIAAARYQAARIANKRQITLDKVNALIDQNTSDRTFGLLGEPRVNVLKLNIALDALK